MAPHSGQVEEVVDNAMLPLGEEPSVAGEGLQFDPLDVVPSAFDSLEEQELAFY
jgi:hypothetical protein